VVPDYRFDDLPAQESAELLGLLVNADQQRLVSLFAGGLDTLADGRGGRIVSACLFFVHFFLKSWR
jgi:hypothetical protein